MCTQRCQGDGGGGGQGWMDGQRDGEALCLASSQVQPFCEEKTSVLKKFIGYFWRGMGRERWLKVTNTLNWCKDWEKCGDYLSASLVSSIQVHPG